MATKVGPKGQVVIEQRIRQALAVEPGSLALQRLVDDHVEIRFVAPPSPRSLRGILKPHVTRWPADPDDTDEVWAQEAERHLGGWSGTNDKE